MPSPHPPDASFENAAEMATPSRRRCRGHPRRQLDVQGPMFNEQWRAGRL